MAINPEDVKLYESQRLTDEDDGGGRATGNEIIDGDINNLFPDISRLDRTLGDVALRKAFVGIATNNQDVYLGAHAIIVEPPADPNVSVVMFDAGSEEDTRLNAQDRIESYVVQGAAAYWELIGNQYENQRQVVAVQREEVELPSAGDVFMIKNGVDQQYIRVTEVDHEIANFTYLSGGSYVDFTRRRMVLSISAPLDYTFPGGQVTPAGTTGSAGDPGTKSEIFGTEVADAARYWGVSTAENAVAQGDLLVKVKDIYSALVPSAQTEQSLVDQVLGYERLSVRSASSATRNETLTALYLNSTDIQVFMNRAAVRGTVDLTLGGSLYLDDGSGILARSSGSNPFTTMQVDYDTGGIIGTRDSGTSSGTIAGSITYEPGAPFTGRAESLSTPITLVNRAYNYNQTFAAAKPRPGSMIVSYMVLGKWYELRDPGNGVMEGSGVGTVDYATGTVSVTLEALPDVDTSIIHSYLMDIEEEVTKRDGVLATALPEIEMTILEGVDPTSLTVTYLAGGLTKTLTDNGVGGLTGDGTGTVNYATGEVKLKLSVLHDDGTTVDVVYNAVTPLSMTNAVNWADGLTGGTIPGAPLKPGSISFIATVYVPTGYPGQTRPINKTVQDDGVGGFIGYSGTINYTTGVYTALEFLSVRSIGYVSIGYGGGTQTVSAPIYEDTRETMGTYTVFIRYQESTAVSAPESSSHTPNQLVLTLVETGDDPIMPASLLFDFAGETYFDRDGILYKGFNSQNSAGTAVGTVNFDERTATLDSWAGGSSPGVTIIACLTQRLNTLVSRIAMRTPGAPLRPQSLQITINDNDGNIISVTADADGLLTDPSLSGSVNIENGVVELWFTTDDADDTGASDVLVFPTGRYNAVLYSFLPLDAELIGLDPVRLPSDGRVPVYREGDVIVLTHTTDTNVGTPIADQVDTLARDNQASIIVVDPNDVELDPAQYTANKLTGVVTFGNPLTLQAADTTPLTGPFYIRDRIEHMSVINDVQIGGDLSFIAPTGHAFPADETVVSSAKVWGDINSRYFSFFTQKTWNSGSPNWTGARIGDDTTANYNDIDNPIEIANQGAITERWAIVFTNSTSFSIVGENLGVIGTGSTSVDLAPNNPNTGFPYFVMRAAGWGGGWASSNVVRFDTDGCLAPVWLARSVKSGQATADDDQFILQIRGDAD